MIELDIFVRHPAYALIPGAVFLLTAASVRSSQRRNGTRVHTSFAVTGCLWVVYSYYEYQMTRYGANIRADLVLIVYPLLALCSVGAAVHALFSRSENPGG